MWDYICAQIDNQTNQTPATLAALAQARTQVTNLRDRIDALRAALRNAAP
jgi:hypothetical protein